jgi:hypothetical protein
VNAPRGSAAQAPIEYADASPEVRAEYDDIIGLANETNRHAVALDLQIDEQFR